MLDKTPNANPKPVQRKVEILGVTPTKFAAEDVPASSKYNDVVEKTTPLPRSESAIRGTQI